MFFLGIDGGGTKTKVYIIDESKNILYENESGPSSIDTVSNDVTLTNINLALHDFFKSNPKATFTSVFAGLGGILDKSYEEELYNIITKASGVTNDTLIIARSDMENALASGMCFDEGITLIAGTGMVAYGKNKQGIEAKAGGLGYQEGDFGSGYSLGYRAMQYVSKSLDGRIEKNNFTIDLANHLNVKTASDIAKLFVEYQTERTKVASFAKIVNKHANNGDKYAQEIINDMTYELALAVNAVYKILDIKNPTLVIVGGLANNNEYFKNQLHYNIKKITPITNIIKPVIDPGYAAALLALKYYNDK